jgi:hypothetical protein
VTAPNGSNPHSERELELSLWEAELNRREERLRHLDTVAPAASDEVAEQLAVLVRRERELLRAVEAVEFQRVQLDAVRAEYEARLRRLDPEAA